MRLFVQAALLILGVVIAALPVSARAQLADYAVDSDDWTGLSSFVELARSRGIELEIRDGLDLAELGTERPLVMVYPSRPIEPRGLGAFIIDGGRILLADDFGQSDALLERLEITRVVPAEGNLPHDRFLDDNPALPLIGVSGRHPLIDGVDEVVANHPAILSNVGGPVIGFDAGGGLVYDMNLGRGKAVVLSDPSLLINQMIGIADNELLLANALSYLCEGREPCRPILLVRDFEVSGAYRGAPAFGNGDLAESVEALNEAVARAMTKVPTEQLLYYLSVILAAGLAIYLATVFPLRRSRRYSAYVSDFLSSIPSPQSEFDWNLARFGGGSRTMNHALPMAILKEIFEELFLRELGLWRSAGGQAGVEAGAQNRPDVEELGRRFAERFLRGKPEAERRRVEADVVELLAAFAQIPPRSRVFLDNDAHFTEPDLVRYYRRAMQILELMGLKDEYTRRTRGAR